LHTIPKPAIQQAMKALCKTDH